MKKRDNSPADRYGRISVDQARRQERIEAGDPNWNKDDTCSCKYIKSACLIHRY
jgi:hypothetical protein